MNFENPLLLFFPVLTVAIFILAGLAMIIFPPKKINHIYGYRTRNSMKNIERWNFAQRYSARLLILFGVIFSLILIIGFVIDLDESVFGVISMILMFLFFGIVFFATEKKLEKFE